MPSTYDCIATTTLTSTSTSIVFSSISQTYTDLVIIFTGTNTTNNNAMSLEMEFNSDPNGNYSYTGILESGSTPTGTGANNYNGASVGATNRNSSGISVINIFSYSNTSTFKSLTASYGTINGPEPQSGANVTMWRNTDAINRIEFNRPAGQSGTFDVGCTFTIYGIKKA